MGALSIAFDITIVGALALPWVLLVVHLFFFEGENRLRDLLAWVKRQDQAAAASVVLFAVAYTLGSAVSRMAQDFFNDDDLHIQLGSRIFRVGATENRILTSVYCKRDDNDLLRAGKENPALLEKIQTFRVQKSYCLCQQSLKWAASTNMDWDDDDLNGTAADIFGLQESAMILKGEDATLRLRQQHDQIMVLRGAAFNGILACAFCLYGWGQQLHREKSRSRWRWLLMLVPGVFLVVGGIGWRNHLGSHGGYNPPYLEFCLLLVGVAGAALLWRPGVAPKEPKTTGASWRGWAGYTVLAAVLTVTTFLGWWSTEVAYAQEVVYSYDSKDAAAQK